MDNFTAHIPPPCHEEVEIVYVDDHLLVVNKPAGLLSVPGRFVKDCVHHRLLYEYADAAIVHRLDLDTSGLMVLTRSKLAAQEVSRQFRERLVKKEYIAMVWGRLDPETGRIDLPLSGDPTNRPRHRVEFESGKEAITDYEVLCGTVDQSLVRLKPLTGRSHQLRVHLAHLGHPILGCDLYAHDAAFKAASRLMLHASKLSLVHPGSGDTVTFQHGAAHLLDALPDTGRGFGPLLDALQARDQFTENF